MKQNDITIHQKHLQRLMIEIYKIVNQDSPELLWNTFTRKTQPYNLRNKNLLKLPPTKSVKYGTNSIVFKGSILWNKLPNDIKFSKDKETFKKNIKKWVCCDCTCKCCS